MTLSLVTRGRICHQSPALALMSWGVICTFVRPFSEADVGFDIDAFVRCGQFIYTKEDPTPTGPRDAALFAVPRANLTGRRSPTLGGRRPSLSTAKEPGLYNRKAAQLTGTKVVRVVGTRRLLLSEPEEPTLTSSGTRAPDLFDKCDCPDPD
jgi:hypothetical protein